MNLSTQKFLVIDTETTGVKPPNDKVVEIAAVTVLGARVDHGFDSLVNPGIPIPPTASAVHHLTDEHVRGAPTLDELAGKLAERAQDAVLVAHNAGFDRSFLPSLADSKWLCTMRLAKHLMPLAPSYSNQALRYWLKLNVPNPGLPPHRAKSDATVTAALFTELLARYVNQEGDNGVDALLDFVNRPITVERMPFGKHKDLELAKVPRDYLRWMLNNCELDYDLCYSIKAIAG